MLFTMQDTLHPSIAWTRRGSLLIAHVLMNGVPLYVVYHVKGFLGVRVDVKVDSVDVTTDSYRVRNGCVFATRGDVHSSEVLSTVYEILDSIPILAPRALA